MMDRLERKKELIEELAEYLTRDLGTRSILLEMGKPEAKEWARLWEVAGMFGYPTKDEAVVTLTQLLG